MPTSPERAMQGDQDPVAPLPGLEDLAVAQQEPRLGGGNRRRPRPEGADLRLSCP